MQQKSSKTGGIHHNPCFYIDDEKGLPLALEYMLTVYETALREPM